MHLNKVKFLATLNLLGLLLLTLALYQNYDSNGLIYLIANGESDLIQAKLQSYQTFQMYMVIFGLVLVEVIIGIIPSVVLYPFAGLLIGSYHAIFVILLGNFIGNVVNYWQGKFIASAFLKQKKNKEYIEKLQTDGAKALFLLRLNPITSFDSISYLAGALNMPFKTFCLVTNIALLPIIILGTIFGNEMLNGYRFGYELLIIITFIYLGLLIRKTKVISKIRNARKLRTKKRSQSNT